MEQERRSLHTLPGRTKHNLQAFPYHQGRLMDIQTEWTHWKLNWNVECPTIHPERCSAKARLKPFKNSQLLERHDRKMVCVKNKVWSFACFHRRVCSMGRVLCGDQHQGKVQRTQMHCISRIVQTDVLRGQCSSPVSISHAAEFNWLPGPLPNPHLSSSYVRNSSPSVIPPFDSKVCRKLLAMTSIGCSHVCGPQLPAPEILLRVLFGLQAALLECQRNEED